MIEIHLTEETAATLWDQGRESGFARWHYETLEFGREKVTVAVLDAFRAEEPVLEEFLMAYLEDLWKQNAAAVWKNPTGEMTWFSKALERMYQGSLK